MEVTADTDRQDPTSWLQQSDGKRYRSWHLCLNNPTEEDRGLFRELADKATYMIVADEVGLECGTPHFQGYVHFANARTQKAILKDLKGRGYVKKAIATAAQNTAYCEKQGNVWLRQGVMPQQGRRTDISEVLAAVRSGATMTDIIENVAENYQALRVAEVAMKYFEPPRDFMPEIRWYHGQSGAGKSRDAMQEAIALAGSPDKVYCPLGFSGKFWEGYDAQEYVVIHDFRADWMPFRVLLQMLDRYQFRVENKGSSRQFRAKVIWITTPYAPEACVPIGEDSYQLIRRLHTIREYQWSDEDHRDRFEPIREYRYADSTNLVHKDLLETDEDSSVHSADLCACNVHEDSVQKYFPAEPVIEDGRRTNYIGERETQVAQREPKIQVYVKGVDEHSSCASSTLTLSFT